MVIQIHRIVLCKSKFASLDFLESTTQKQPDSGNPIISQEDAKPKTDIALCKSSRFILNYFSPSLNHILLTDSDESQSYKEIMQNANFSKWEIIHGR